MIKLKNTQDQIELVKAIGNKDPAVSRPAQEAFAAAMGPVIAQVLDQAGTASLIYEDMTFGEDESPSFPLDAFYGEDAGFITIWSQEIAGGLSTSEVVSSGDMKISTYRLDSAVAFLKKYARKSNLNVLSKSINRLLQELLVKQERMAWSVICRSLGEAVTKVNGVQTKHTIASTTQNVLQIDDFSRLITLNRRLNSSFAGGTTKTPYSKGVTDIFLSPEMKEQIRGFSFNPMNTRGVPNSDESTALGLPESVRTRIFDNLGADEIFGVNITDLNELGLSQKYNVLFGNFATAGIANAGGNFSTSTDEILIALDLTKGAFIRAVGADENNGTVAVLPDDQYVAREDKSGFYATLEEGRVQIDGRASNGLVV